MLSKQNYYRFNKTEVMSPFIAEMQRKYDCILGITPGVNFVSRNLYDRMLKLENEFNGFLNSSINIENHSLNKNEAPTYKQSNHYNTTSLTKEFNLHNYIWQFSTSVSKVKSAIKKGESNYSINALIDTAKEKLLSSTGRLKAVKL